MNKIIYKNKDNTIGILTPIKEVLSLVGIKAIAEKDVPFDLPYWIVDGTQIPTDKTFRDAWEIDESSGAPDGFGGESNEFKDEQLLIIYISKFISMIKIIENETVVQHITNNKEIYAKIGLLIREFIPNKEDRISSYNLYFDNKMIQDSLMMVDNTLDMELSNDNSK